MNTQYQSHEIFIYSIFLKHQQQNKPMNYSLICIIIYRYITLNGRFSIKYYDNIPKNTKNKPNIPNPVGAAVLVAGFPKLKPCPSEAVDVVGWEPRANPDGVVVVAPNPPKIGGLLVVAGVASKRKQWKI